MLLITAQATDVFHKMNQLLKSGRGFYSRGTFRIGLYLDVGVWGGGKPWTIVKAASVFETAVQCIISLTLETSFLNKTLCPRPQIIVPVVVVRIKEIVIVKTWRGWRRAAQEGRGRESNGRCWQLVGI